MKFLGLREIRDVRVVVFSGMVYLQDEKWTLRGSGVAYATDGLNDLEGVLDCFDTCHHLDEGQFFDHSLFRLSETAEGKSKERRW